MDKFYIAVKTLNSQANFTYDGDMPTNEEQFNNVKWFTSSFPEEATYGDAPSEITWTAVKKEMDKL